MLGGRRLPLALGAVLVLVALASAACSSKDAAKSGADPSSSLPIDGAEFSARVDHRLVPLATVRTTVFEGSERRGVKLRIESTVLDQTEVVAGVTVTVVEVEEYENGELAERTLDYYAQHRDGSVWYFGERVDDYAGGAVVGHSGQWLAGEGRALPGLFMPAQPTVGLEFEQERAPGIAEDRSTVVAVGVSVTTPAGSFTDCIKTEDHAPLDRATERKYYCPGVGLVREEHAAGNVDLVGYR